MDIEQEQQPYLAVESRYTLELYQVLSGWDDL